MVLASKGPKIVLVLDAIFENFDFWTFPASGFRIITVFCYLFSRLYEQKLSQIEKGGKIQFQIIRMCQLFRLVHFQMT